MNGPFSPWEKDRMRGKMIIYLDPLTPTPGFGILHRRSAECSLKFLGKPRRRCF